jgi:hypothetical protein
MICTTCSNQMKVYKGFDRHPDNWEHYCAECDKTPKTSDFAADYGIAADYDNSLTYHPEHGYMGGLKVASHVQRSMEAWSTRRLGINTHQIKVTWNKAKDTLECYRRPIDVTKGEWVYFDRWSEAGPCRHCWV